MFRGRPRLLLVLALLATTIIILPLIAGCTTSEDGDGDGDKVSAPGEYSGYSEPLYTGYETTSQYVTSFDGTKIAVDVYRPTGGPDEPLPAVLIMTPYHRASVMDGEVVSEVSEPPPIEPYQTILSYGYVVVFADVRGTGASYGTRFAIFDPPEVQDGNSLVEWIVEQPWCDGNVGMMGDSYRAFMQFFNATNLNPHLKCIIPRYCGMDLYDFVYPGGIVNFNFIEVYDVGLQALNMNETKPALDVYPSKPVDSDTDGSMLAEATQEHADNGSLVEVAEQLPFRDSVIESPWGALGYPVPSPSGHLQEIEDSGVVVYNMGGWLDGWGKDTLTFQETLSNESKLLMGDYDHTQGFENFDIECVRFFDRYLKGVENGIDEEAPIYIYTTGREEWSFVDAWPLPDQVDTPYYFEADGALSTDEPAAEGSDDYTVDYTTSSGLDTRWTAVAGYASDYKDRAEEDEKCLTYTTPPLDADVEVTGHPILHLYTSVNATDGDFFVYLEDIDENGYAQYKTEGELRASLRSLGERPWLPELPYHPSGQGDVQPLVPGEMVELVIDLYPISHVFKQGHSIRVSLAGADRHNFRTPKQDPPPTYTIYTGGENASYIDLPVIP
jgi:putative CocE/NonD family hydrolase